MARGLGDVLDAFVDGARPRLAASSRVLHVPIEFGGRLAVGLTESLAVHLSRLGVGVGIEPLDSATRALCRPTSSAAPTRSELRFELASPLATGRTNTVLLICSDAEGAAEWILRFRSRAVARDILLIDVASCPSESASLRWLAKRYEARWIASIPARDALRASVAWGMASPPCNRAAQALRDWLRSAPPRGKPSRSHPLGVFSLPKNASE